MALARAQAREEFLTAVGRDGLVEDPVELRSYECDGLTGYRVTPALVLLPRTTEQVAAAVRVCARHRIPFVARGAGTGLSGGALPVADGVVISVQRLRAVLDVDPRHRRARVQPGVTNLDITRAVARHGLYFAPDPSSQQVCTIGGNVAENSGGAHCLKYGFTVNHVLAVEVVLPDGTVTTLGGDSAHQNGYDLLGTFIDLAEVCAAVRDTAASAPRLLLSGTGSAAGWGGPPEPPDAVLDTTALTGVLAHEPADMTVAVRAGTRLADLQAELAASGQRLAFDPARSGATLGGLLATADSGPLQQSHGTLRDLVIGITVVLADGTAAGSGGHVIKNVAGYDLAKLFHGSLGTLGVVTEVVLRLHPLPESVRTVAVAATPPDAYALADRILAHGLEPAALGWVAGRLLVRLEGTADGTRRRAEALRALTPDATGALLLPDTEAEAHWTAFDRVSLGGAGDTLLRFGALPTTAARLVDALPRADGAVGIEVAGSVGVGVYTVRLHGPDPQGHAAVTGRLRDAVDRAGGSCTLLHRDGLPDDFPAWGAPPASVAVMGAIKHGFDPGGRFGAGRFAGWLPAPPGATTGTGARPRSREA